MRLVPVTVLLFLACAAFADVLPPGSPDETVQAEMIAYDAAHGAPIPDATLLVTFQSGSTYSVTDADGDFSLMLPQGTSSVDIGADLDSTPGYDYIITSVRVPGTPNERINFAPAGSVSGSIQDSSGAPLPNEAVSLSCTGFSRTTSTDASGRFEFEFAPAGDCTVSFSAASRSVHISQGQVASADLAPAQPQPTPTPSGEGLWMILAVVAGIIFLGIVLLLMGVILLFVVRHLLLRGRATEPEEAAEIPEPRPQQAAPTRAAPGEFKPTSGQLDVMQTLPTREYDIVKLLLVSGGKMRASKIRHALAIPKTSFFRIIASLEGKNIVESEEGKIFPEIRLKKWFLSK